MEYRFENEIINKYLEECTGRKYLKKVAIRNILNGKFIDLKGTKITNNDLELMSMILGGDFMVENADLSNVKLSEFSRLPKLELFDCHIPKKFFKGAHISDLTIIGCDLNDDTIKDIGEVQGVTNICLIGQKYFDMEKIYFDYPNFGTLSTEIKNDILSNKKYYTTDKIDLNSFGKNELLKCLEIQNVTVSESTKSPLMRNLKKLTMHNVSGIYENLPEAENLEVLELNKCDLKSIKKIAEIYPNLKSVDINDNPLTEFSIDDLKKICMKGIYFFNINNAEILKKCGENFLNFEGENIEEIKEFLAKYKVNVRSWIENTGREIEVNGKANFRILKKMLENLIVLPEKIVLKIKNINELQENEVGDLQKYVKKIKLSSLIGLDKEKIDKIGEQVEYTVEGDLTAYTANDMKKIIEIMEEIKSKMPNNADEFTKFKIVYEILSKAAKYDMGGCMDSPKFEKEKLYKTRDLMGVLHRGRAVCYGYALALKYVLDFNHIDATLINGYAHNDPINEGHAWNQVKINGKWYNADLTWDAERIQRGEEYKYCLINDAKFYREHMPKEDVSLCKDDFNWHIKYADDETKISLNDEHIGNGVMALFDVDDYKQVAQNTVIKDNIIEKIKCLKEIDERKEEIANQR